MKKKDLNEVYGILYRYYGPQHWWPGETPLEIMIGAVLTQNTAWTNVEKAIANLKRTSALSSPAAVMELGPRRLSLLIRPAGFYNIKSSRVRNYIKFLLSRYRGISSELRRQKTGILREELLNISGIGPETCDSILLYALNRPIFVVDAYTRRIFSRHGLLKGGEPYGLVQDIFMAGLPRSVRLFNEYHALIVKCAKDFCRTKPKCGMCPLKGIKVLANKVPK